LDPWLSVNGSHLLGAAADIPMPTYTSVRSCSDSRLSACSVCLDFCCFAFSCHHRMWFCSPRPSGLSRQPARLPGPCFCTLPVPMSRPTSNCRSVRFLHCFSTHRESQLAAPLFL